MSEANSDSEDNLPDLEEIESHIGDDEEENDGNPEIEVTLFLIINLDLI